MFSPEGQTLMGCVTPSLSSLLLHTDVFYITPQAIFLNGDLTFITQSCAIAIYSITYAGNMVPVYDFICIGNYWPIRKDKLYIMDL